MSASATRPTAPFAKSCWTVFTEATTAKNSAVKDTLKAFGYIGKWWELCDPKLATNYKNFFAVGGDGKNILSTLEMFKNVGEVADSFTNKRTYYKIDSLCRLSNNGGDFMKLLSRFFKIPHMKHIEGVSGAFTLVGAVNNAIEHGHSLWNLDKLSEEHRWNNGVHQVINLISDFSYMVFGALAVAVWLGLLVVPTVAVLLPLTIALVCSFTNYYFKNLVTLNDENRDSAQVNAFYNNLPQSLRVST